MKAIKKPVEIDFIYYDGTKKSLKGLLGVYRNWLGEKEGEIIVKTECTPEEENGGLLQVIYEDGKFYNQISLNEIRQKINNDLTIQFQK